MFLEQLTVLLSVLNIMCRRVKMVLRQVAPTATYSQPMQAVYTNPQQQFRPVGQVRHPPLERTDATGAL